MPELRLDLKDELATQQAGADIALALSPEMSVHLLGDLGAGKTCIARAIIRQLAGDQELEVPSPTFSLVQHYSGSSKSGIASIEHCDLYRVNDPLEITELDISDPNHDQLILIEWPQNGEGELSKPSLTLALEEHKSHRVLTITGPKKTLEKIERSLLIREFLDHAWDANCKREKFFGDASARTYEMVSFEDETRLLMNAPKQADGPIIRDGKPYSQIAHLAEGMDAFCGVQQILQKAGFSVPRIFAEDLDEGLLLLENLGSEAIIDNHRNPIKERYLASVEMLAKLHQSKVCFESELDDARIYQVPDYSQGAMQIETELLIDWYAPRMVKDIGKEPISDAQKEEFNSIWIELIKQLEPSEKHLILRDFHSPNIIWLAQRCNTDRIGLIDFQDAVVGPSAFDVASLAQDARVDIPANMENEIVDHYVKCRNDATFNETQFRQDYAIMAAQRATKILGIFVRLDERDGKSDYLEHLPRVQDYILRSLAHPILNEYRNWYQSVIN